MIGNLLSYFGAAAGSTCSYGSSSFLGLPRWYEYLKPVVDTQGKCVATIHSINDVWLIVAAGIDILLRLAALAAVAIVIYGGISYILSQGDPERVARSKNTIIDAGIGLVISIVAASVISFIAKSIQ